MKKILSLALMALTLFVQHESHAMANLRNYAGRIGQQCARLYTQGAQQVAPAYRTLTTGARQQLSNLRPQTSRWYSTARNWSQNLNLPTARTTALGLGGAGLTTAAYLQRPDIFGVVRAEEETPTDIFTDIRMQLNNLKTRTHTKQELQQLKNRLKFLVTDKDTYYRIDRKNFASAVDDLLNMQKIDLHKELRTYILNSGSVKMGTFVFLAQNVLNDIALTNAVNDLADISDPSDPTVKIEIPTIYIHFFKEISKDNDLKKSFINAINELDHPITLKEMVDLNDDHNISKQDKIQRYTLHSMNRGKILKQISDILEGKSSSFWSYFGY